MRPGPMRAMHEGSRMPAGHRQVCGPPPGVGCHAEGVAHTPQTRCQRACTAPRPRARGPTVREHADICSRGLDLAALLHHGFVTSAYCGA
eukprot:362178-Chlamydomonas_euryale.AAC.1